VITQVPVPEQPPPDQPVKVEPDPAVAVRVTVEPPGKSALQVAPQLMPVGALPTDPVPVPARVTVNGNVTGAKVKVAVTPFAASIVTAQAPVPEHPLDQPAKVESEPATAFNVTIEPVA
jgi:hypothetical protein